MAPRFVISASELDDLMNQGWQAPSTVRIDGWLVRLADGVTQRANSVLPIAAPRELPDAVARVEKLYQDRGLAPSFQISPAAQPTGLDQFLAGKGYELRSPTNVQVATVEAVLRRLPLSYSDVDVHDQPDENWMDLWWAVDGRGGAEARSIARRILTTGPAVYASGRDGAGTAAIGRLALVGQWAGVYCMVVRPDLRRRGYAMSVLRALFEHAVNLGIRSTWLQVVADNDAARALYRKVGFVDLSAYHYRTMRVQRP